MKINNEIMTKFSDKFNTDENEGVSSKYVFIGGTALMLLSTESDAGEIRGTRDYDIVLLVKDSEGNKELFIKLWEYITEGKYKCYQNKDGTPQYYRFTKPENRQQYPELLEFFSSAPEFMKGREERFTPIYIDEDVQSLSSIIMEDDYYDFILTQCRIVLNVNSVTELGLIALKAKAYNDLLERTEKGEQIRPSNLNKHKDDVIQVLNFIKPDNVCDLSGFPSIESDIQNFIENLEKIYPDGKIIKVGNIETNIEEIRDDLQKHFCII